MNSTGINLEIHPKQCNYDINTDAVLYLPHKESTEPSININTSL